MFIGFDGHKMICEESFIANLGYVWLAIKNTEDI